MKNGSATTAVRKSTLPVYGTIFRVDQPFRLESGEVLPNLKIAYETYGALDSGGTNGILVCHALTGSAHAGDNSEGPGGAPGWWNGIIGSGKGFDTGRYFVVCVNILGSCYGTTGPASINPATGERYGLAFPQVTVRDMVRAQRLLLAALGVRELAAVIGGSLGGMQVLEWGILFPEFVRTIIPVATSAHHSAWCIGFDEAQRLAITSDPHWREGKYDEQPAEGLAIARMIAMMTYRSRASFGRRFGRENPGDDRKPLGVFEERPPAFQVESYLRYQGQKLAERFDANTYLYLTKAMDFHDTGAGRGGIPRALAGIKARTLCVGISSDILYPPEEQQEIAALIPGAKYVEINSPDGHDAFLIEFEQLNRMIREFLG